MRDARSALGSCARLASVVCLTSATLTAAVGAQQADTARSAPAARHRLLVAGAVIATTVAIAPFDQRIATFLQRPRLQHESDLQHAAQDAAFMGGPGPFLLGAALYAGGRLTGERSVAGLGLHLTQAVLLAASVTAVGKGISGRSIPQQSAGEPDDFQFGRGFHRGNGPYVSFPSGHTAAGFAMAAVFTGEASRWRPAAARFIGPIAYGGAAAIGVARMYQNVHWATDLPVAAAIGTWSGMTVVSYQHAHPRNRLDRWLLGTAVAPSGQGGVALTWHLPTGDPAR